MVIEDKNLNLKLILKRTKTWYEGDALTHKDDQILFVTQDKSYYYYHKVHIIKDKIHISKLHVYSILILIMLCIELLDLSVETNHQNICFIIKDILYMYNIII